MKKTMLLLYCAACNAPSDPPLAIEGSTSYIGTLAIDAGIDTTDTGDTGDMAIDAGIDTTDATDAEVHSIPDTGIDATDAGDIVEVNYCANSASSLLHSFCSIYASSGATCLASCNAVVIAYNACESGCIIGTYPDSGGIIVDMSSCCDYCARPFDKQMVGCP